MTPFLHLPSCRDAAERLSDFLDDELDDGARHEVALHLAICGACAELAVELAETVHALHGLGSVGTSARRASLARERGGG